MNASTVQGENMVGREMWASPPPCSMFDGCDTEPRMHFYLIFLTILSIFNGDDIEPRKNF